MNGELWCVVMFLLSALSCVATACKEAQTLFLPRWDGYGFARLSRTTHHILTAASFIECGTRQEGSKELFA